MAEKLNIVLCGLGRMGRIHIKNISRSHKLQLKYVVEKDIKLAHRVVHENAFTDTQIVDFVDARKAIEDQSISGVIICTPTDTHEVILKMALQAGKHVLCEKPLSTDLKMIVECYEIAKQKGLVLLCAFNRRFDPQLHELHSIREKVGIMQSIKICSRDSPRPSTPYLEISGGVFHDCIVHDLDVVRWMTGEEPETIYSIAHCHDPEIKALDDHDSVFVVMKFPSGILAHIDISRNCKFGYDQTVQLYGSNGNLVSDNPRKSALTVNGGKVTDDICFSFPDRYEHAYIIELNHFTELMGDKEAEWCIKPKDTLLATFLAQAAEDSWREKKIINVEEHKNVVFGKLACDVILNQ